LLLLKRLFLRSLRNSQLGTSGPVVPDNFIPGGKNQLSNSFERPPDIPIEVLFRLPFKNSVVDESLDQSIFERVLRDDAQPPSW